MHGILPAMIDFPMTDLLDASACVAWLEQNLHPTGLVCPRGPGTKRRLGRSHPFFPTYRCRIWKLTYTILIGSVFARPPPASRHYRHEARMGLPKAKVPPGSRANSALIANASASCGSRSKPISTLPSLAK